MSADVLTIGELVERGQAEIRTGPFGTQLRASDYAAVGVPVLNVRNLGFGSVRARISNLRTLRCRLGCHLTSCGRATSCLAAKAPSIGRSSA